jgi:hypothetical protein
MPDEPIIDAVPVPIRSRPGLEGLAPPQAVVRELHASLRATAEYVRVLIDRIELAESSDLVRLDGVPANVLVQLTAHANALQRGADSALDRLDPNLARSVGAVADLARQSASPPDWLPGGQPDHAG